MPLPATQRAKPDAISGEQRLNGWKEIASYLARGERTVKRWDSDRGLPIHRIPGGGRAAVHAFKSELDQWLQSSRATELESVETKDETPAVDLPIAFVNEQSGPVALSEAPASRLSYQGKGFVSIGAFLLVGLLLLIGFVVYPPHHLAAGTSSSQLSETEKSLAGDLYLRGRFEWNKRTAESLNRALDDFTQSIVHDPTSARAYAGLADTYILLHEYSVMPAPEAYSRAIAAATKAIELDDSLADAHRSLAFAEVWGNWDFYGADREFRRAIALNPRDPLTHLWFATAFEAPSWYTHTSREFALAQELDPTSAVVLANKSIWLFENGQQRAGLEMAHQVERDDPDFPAPHRYLAMMYWSRRDYPDFLLESEKTADLVHDPLLKKINAATREGYQRDGERGLLDALYVARKLAFQTGQPIGADLPEVCIRLDMQDEAFQVLQDEANHHSGGLLAILTNPEIRKLENDPRFQQLLARLNYPNPPSMDQ